MSWVPFEELDLNNPDHLPQVLHIISQWDPRLIELVFSEENSNRDRAWWEAEGRRLRLENTGSEVFPFSLPTSPDTPIKVGDFVGIQNSTDLGNSSGTVLHIDRSVVPHSILIQTQGGINCVKPLNEVRLILSSDNE